MIFLFRPFFAALLSVVFRWPAVPHYVLAGYTEYFHINISSVKGFGGRPCLCPCFQEDIWWARHGPMDPLWAPSMGRIQTPVQSLSLAITLSIIKVNPPLCMRIISGKNYSFCEAETTALFFHWKCGCRLWTCTPFINILITIYLVFSLQGDPLDKRLMNAFLKHFLKVLYAVLI